MDAAELARWTRFAAKGGIGKCTAIKDCVAKSDDDLMFLKGDEIVVLMQIAGDKELYLGYCEGVIGRFSRTHVRFHAKLKKPVITKRPGSSSGSTSSPSVNGSPLVNSGSSPSMGSVASTRGSSSIPEISTLSTSESASGASVSASDSSSAQTSDPTTLVAKQVDDDSVMISKNIGTLPVSTSSSSSSSGHSQVAEPSYSSQSVSDANQPLKFLNTNHYATLAVHGTEDEADRNARKRPDTISAIDDDAIHEIALLPQHNEDEHVSTALPGLHRVGSGDAIAERSDVWRRENAAISRTSSAEHVNRLQGDVQDFSFNQEHEHARIRSYIHANSPSPLSSYSSRLSQMVEPSSNLSRGSLHHSPVEDDVSEDESQSDYQDNDNEEAYNSDHFHPRSTIGVGRRPPLGDLRDSVRLSSSLSSSPVVVERHMGAVRRHASLRAVLENENNVKVEGVVSAENDADEDEAFKSKSDEGHGGDEAVVTPMEPVLVAKTVFDSPTEMSPQEKLPAHEVTLAADRREEYSDDDASLYLDDDDSTQTHGTIHTTATKNPEFTQGFAVARPPTAMSEDGGFGVGMAMLQNLADLSSDDEDDEPIRRQTRVRDAVAEAGTIAPEIHLERQGTVKASENAYATNLLASASSSTPSRTSASPHHHQLHIPDASDVNLTLPPSPIGSVHPSSHSSTDDESEWEGADDIYDDYRYSRYSMASKVSRLSMNSKNSGGSGSIGSVAALSALTSGALPSASASKTSLTNRSNRSTRLFGSQDMENLQQRLQQDESIPPVPDPVAEVQALLGRMVSDSQDHSGEIDFRPSSRSSLLTGQLPMDVPASRESYASTLPTASVAPLSIKRNKSRPSPLDLSTSPDSGTNTPLSILSPSPIHPSALESKQALQQLPIADQRSDPMLKSLSPSHTPSRALSPALSIKSNAGAATALRQRLENEIGNQKEEGRMGRRLVIEEELLEEAAVKPQHDEQDQGSNPPNEPSASNAVSLESIGDVSVQTPSKMDDIQTVQALSTQLKQQNDVNQGDPSFMSLSASQRPFLPHPNAPKPNPATAGQRRSVLGLLSPNQPSPYAQQQPTAGPSAMPNDPDSKGRLNGSRNVIVTMRMALQYRFGPGGVIRPITIYGRTITDLSNADGPVGIIWSIEPFEAAPSPSPSPRPMVNDNQGMSKPPTRAASTTLSGGHGGASLRVPDESNGLNRPNAQPPPSPSPSSSTNVLPRANFFPKIVTTRPRSRSFSGFSTANAEFTLPITQKIEQASNNGSGYQDGAPFSRPPRSLTLGASVTEKSPVNSTSSDRTPGTVSQSPGRSNSPSSRSTMRSRHTPSPLSLSHNNTIVNPKSTKYKAPPSPLSRPPISPQISTTDGQPPSGLDSNQQLQQLASQKKQLGLRQVVSSITLKSTPESSSVANSSIVSLPVRRNSGPESSLAQNKFYSNAGPMSNSKSLAGILPQRTGRSDLNSHSSSTPEARGSVEGSLVHLSDSRSAIVTSPPPMFGTSSSSSSSSPIRRSNSLKTKVSLSLLRGRHDSKIKDPESPHDTSHSYHAETVQVKDTDFELIRPIRQVSTDRSSEDSLGIKEQRPSVITDAPLEDPMRASFTSPINVRSQSLISDSPTSPSRSPNSQEDPVSMEAHRARELRWMSAISSTPASQARKNKKVRKMLLEGVPSSVRYLVWEHLTDSKVRQIPGVYAQLGKRGRVNASDEIERDVRNYFNGHQPLQSSNEPLILLLQSYLTMVPDLDYNFNLVVLAGHLLLQSPEEVAFWIFVSIMDVYLRPYFSARSVQIDADAILFHRTMESYDAQLTKRLYVDVGLPMEDICRIWFSSLFASSLPPEYVNRIWDVFLFEGHPFLIRVGLSIINSSRRALTEMRDPAQLLALLRRPPRNLLPPDPEAFLASALSFKVKDDDIKKQRAKLETQLRRQTHGPTSRSISAYSNISLPR